MTVGETEAMDGVAARLERDAAAAIRAAETTEALADAVTAVLGKRSALARAHRDLAGLDPDARREAGRMLHDARQQLEASTGRLREVLNRHRRMVLCVKSASEGLVKAIAEEVDRRRARTRPYSALGALNSAAKPSRAQAPGASLVYDTVI